MVNCEICDEYSSSMCCCDKCSKTLCGKCQVACNNCSRILCAECYDSDSNVCYNCLCTCDDCSSVLSPSDTNSCSERYCNNSTLCDNCAYECDQCGEIFCYEHFHADIDTCTNCAYTCPDCHEVVSPDELCGCAVCGDTVCSNCIHYVNEGESLCGYCFRNPTFVNFDDYKDNQKVLDYNFSPEWSFTKQPWENTLYLGIELEIELNDSKQETCFEIAKDCFPESDFIWKHDGSLNNGMEFVLSPHTFQSIRKLKFRDFLKKLINAGVKSWDPGTCGLHVHVNQEALPKNAHKKLRRFFEKNEYKIRKLSGRCAKNFDNWCGIYRNDKYSALHPTSRGTLEFRIFRGSLNYTRFKANLTFVQAIIEFVCHHSVIVCGSQNSFKYFLDFVKENYQHLYKFLGERGLCA